MHQENPDRGQTERREHSGPMDKKTYAQNLIDQMEEHIDRLKKGIANGNDDDLAESSVLFVSYTNEASAMISGQTRDLAIVSDTLVFRLMEVSPVVAHQIMRGVTAFISEKYDGDKDRFMAAVVIEMANNMQENLHKKDVRQSLIKVVNQIENEDLRKDTLLQLDRIADGNNFDDTTPVSEEAKNAVNDIMQSLARQTGGKDN